MYISAPIADFLASRFIDGRLRGVPRGVAVMALNVGVGTPVSSAIVALLFTQPDDFLTTYLTALATTMPMTMILSYFVVGPAVKLAFNNRIKPDGGLRAFRILFEHATSFARLLGM